MTDMNILFDREIFALRKDRAAEQFSNHDFLLRHVGEDFADRLAAILREFPCVVNVGAYNGALVDALGALSRLGPVVHLDSSASMFSEAQGQKIVCDEEFLPFKDGSIDLFLSAFGLHFVNDLPGVLVQLRRSLRPDGLALIALPGARTLFELRDAFSVAESEIDGGISPRVGPFADIRDCGGLLQRAGFALPVVDSYEVRVTYETPFALMKELRAMGASNVLRERRRVPLRRSTLLRVVEVYLERYGLENGRVPATFEVITLTGWAPHEGQQKPLRPGSAKSRLSDALGVSERGFEPSGKRGRKTTA